MIFKHEVVKEVEKNVDINFDELAERQKMLFGHMKNIEVTEHILHGESYGINVDFYNTDGLKFTACLECENCEPNYYADTQVSEQVYNAFIKINIKTEDYIYHLTDLDDIIKKIFKEYEVSRLSTE